MRNKNVFFGDASFISKPQQIIVNEFITKGVYYSENIDYLYSNMCNANMLLDAMTSNFNSALFSGIFDDIEDFRNHLKNHYIKEYKLYHTSLINLTFSEN